MVVHRRKKVVKYRGSVTHGGGSRKKRRGAGSRGGRGRAGTGKRAGHKKNVKGFPALGRKGFTSRQRVGRKLLVINVGDLEKKIRKGKIKEGELIDLASQGVDKLLGAGKVGSKLKVKVLSFSRQAEEKIRKAGGEIVGAGKPGVKESEEVKESRREN